jgi:hypothetical protein
MFSKTLAFISSGQRSCPDAHSRLFQLKEGRSPKPPRTEKTARADVLQKLWRI